MFVRPPVETKELQDASRQRDIAIVVAFAVSDVKEHAVTVDVANLQVETFAEPEATGVEGGEEDSMAGKLDVIEQESDFLGGKDDREFEVGSRPDDRQLVRPRPTKSQLPEDFDGTEGLVGGGVSELFDRLEVNEVRLNLWEGEQIGSAIKVLAELTNTSEIGLLGAG